MTPQRIVRAVIKKSQVSDVKFCSIWDLLELCDTTIPTDKDTSDVLFNVTQWYYRPDADPETMYPEYMEIHHPNCTVPCLQLAPSKIINDPGNIKHKDDLKNIRLISTTHNEQDPSVKNASIIYRISDLGISVLYPESTVHYNSILHYQINIPVVKLPRKWGGLTFGDILEMGILKKYLLPDTQLLDNTLEMCKYSVVHATDSNVWCTIEDDMHHECDPSWIRYYHTNECDVTNTKAYAHPMMEPQNHSVLVLPIKPSKDSLNGLMGVTVEDFQFTYRPVLLQYKSPNK